MAGIERTDSKSMTSMILNTNCKIMKEIWPTNTNISCPEANPFARLFGQGISFPWRSRILLLYICAYNRFIYIRAKAMFFFDLCRCCCCCSINTQIGNNATGWKRRRFHLLFCSNLNEPHEFLYIKAKAKIIFSFDRFCIRFHFNINEP